MVEEHRDRDEQGRFAKGNAGGPGNPYAATTARLRAALLSAVTEQDIRDVIAALVAQARQGNVPAARELLERVCGRVPLTAIGTDDGTGEQRLFVVIE